MEWDVTVFVRGVIIFVIIDMIVVSVILVNRTCVVLDEAPPTKDVHVPPVEK